jgi:5-formyltetrahydrofolate cyclo-ligase
MGPAPTSPSPAGGDELREEKRALRARLLARRAARSDGEREAAGRALLEVVLGLPQVRAARCIAAYVSRHAEPPTRDLLELLRQRSVRVLVPVIGGERRLGLGWADYAGPAGLAEPLGGRPLEPTGPHLGPTALEAAGVVLVPALAVDTSGTRLGYGAGWYDRALRFAAPGAVLIALVYDDELLDATTSPLPRGPGDTPVGSAATPSGWTSLGAAP